MPRSRSRSSPAAGASAWPSPASWRGSPTSCCIDEPTNHLDLEGILWLEDLLQSAAAAPIVVVSHDRYFLENVAAPHAGARPRAIPSGSSRPSGTYSDFLEKRDEILRNQAEYQAVARQQGAPRDRVAAPRAPRPAPPRPRARIEEANRLIAELTELRERARRRRQRPRRHRLQRLGPQDQEAAGGRGAQQVARRPPLIVQGLDLMLTPGTRLGLLGPNGSGKTTLLSPARRRPGAGRGHDPARGRAADRPLRAGPRRRSTARQPCAARWPRRATR